MAQTQKAKLPLSTQRFTLPLFGVLVQCLDENQRPLHDGAGSGFLRRESDELFLYTCWHVVSGFDPNEIKVGLEPVRRRYLRITLQAAEPRGPGVEAIGGAQTIVLPLYDTAPSPRPLWLQDDQHIPHPDLNPIGLHVPFWHDVVKLKLPNDLRVSEMQVVGESRTSKGFLIGPGEKCLVVGYPYGFSTAGPAQPTPVALTRFVASQRIAGRRSELLLESSGAPTMSGGPVFIEHDNDLLLFGIYTGAIYPDYPHANEKVTALGTVCDLSLLFAGALRLVSTPSQPLTSEGHPVTTDTSPATG